MKKSKQFLLLSTVLIAAFAVTTVSVSAEETTETPTLYGTSATKIEEANIERQKLLDERAKQLEERKAEVEAKRAEVEAKRAELQDKKEEVEAKREEFKAKLAEKVKERVENRLGHITNKMNAMVERLEKIADRVDSRIAKLKEKGVDTASSEALNLKARNSIAAAQVAIDAIDTEALLNSDDPKEAFQNVKNETASAKEALRSAHKDLVEAIKSLKANTKTETGSETKNDDSTSTETN